MFPYASDQSRPPLTGLGFRETLFAHCHLRGFAMPGMETVTIPYKGFVISHLKIPLMGTQYSVNVGSDDRKLAMLIRETIFNDNRSFEGGIALAKHYIDSVVN